MEVHQRPDVHDGKAQLPGTAKEGGLIFCQSMAGRIPHEVAVLRGSQDGHPLRRLPAGKGRQADDSGPRRGGAQNGYGVAKGAVVRFRPGIFGIAQRSAPVPVVGSVPENAPIRVRREDVFPLQTTGQIVRSEGGQATGSDGVVMQQPDVQPAL